MDVIVVDVNTILVSYDTLVLNAVSKLPDLASNVNSFTFLKTSMLENADTETAEYTTQIETAIKNLIIALYDKVEDTKEYVSSLTFINLSAAAVQYAYEQSLIPSLNALHIILSSAVADLQNILSSIDSFNTSIFGAFSIAGSKQYTEVAKILPTNYPLTFIQRTQDFITSGKELDVYTSDVYANSPPALLIAQLIQNNPQKIANINNYVLPTNAELISIAMTYVEPVAESTQ